MPDLTVPHHFAMNVPVGVQTPTGGIFMLRPYSPSSRARCNILHVAPQTRDLATHGPDRGLPIPDQHRTTEVALRSIRDGGVDVEGVMIFARWY